MNRYVPILITFSHLFFQIAERKLRWYGLVRRMEVVQEMVRKHGWQEFQTRRLLELGEMEKGFGVVTTMEQVIYQ